MPLAETHGEPDDSLQGSKFHTHCGVLLSAVAHHDDVGAGCGHGGCNVLRGKYADKRNRHPSVKKGTCPTESRIGVKRITQSADRFLSSQMALQAALRVEL